MKNKDVQLFTILILLSLGMIVMGEKPRVETGKALGRVVFFPFQKGVSFIEDLVSLRSENRNLNTRLTELSLQIQFLQEYRYENKSLRKLLAFKEKGKFDLLPAEVIGRSPGQMNHTIIIDRGENSGIQVNMPVVTDEGIVGKVSEVSNRTALVQTLLDRNCRVSAFIQKSRGLGIVKWQGGTTLLFDNLPIQEDVRVGDQIISSGLGGIFPKGLQIGVIHNIREGRRGLFHEIEVEPAVTSKVEDVFIILGESKISQSESMPEIELPILKDLLPEKKTTPPPPTSPTLSEEETREDKTSHPTVRKSFPEAEGESDTSKPYTLPEPEIRNNPSQPPGKSGDE
jgi:rod shape-determining protein MreC